MRKNTLIAALAVALLCAISAPRATAADVEDQSRKVLTKIVNWVPNLVLDGVDIFKATVGIGRGNGIDVRLTRLLAAGFSNYSITRYGLNGRHDAIYNEEVNDGGIGLAGFVFGELERDPYEVGFTFHIVNGGIDFSLNLHKALDFFGGILFMDIEDDNKEYF